jgi:hypothetical protein
MLNVRGINDVRQTEMYRTEPLGPEPCSFEFEIAIEKFKNINYRVLIKFRQN